MDMRLVVLDIIHIVDNGEGRGGGQERRTCSLTP